jgi:hypothetical protein
MCLGCLGYEGRRNLGIRGHDLYSDHWNHKRRHHNQPATVGGVCGGLGSNVDRPFQRAATIHGVVVAAVNGAFETCHKLGGLVTIQVGLARPCKVRRVNVTSMGQ